MKLVTFTYNDYVAQAGWVKDNHIYSIRECSNGKLPDNVLDFLKNAEANEQEVKLLMEQNCEAVCEVNEAELLAPLPNPSSFRDFMAFEEHILNASKRSNIEMHPNWYKLPAFYFSNHQAIKGPNEEIAIPPNCERFDFELEIAIIIGKEGTNIKAEDADDYIFGYTILNDWSARDLQLEEMTVSLGPAKGKDAATSIGPYLVTKEELEGNKLGDRYDLKMTAKVNGQQVSEGNFKDIYHTFGDMIERSSSGVTLYPGDIIGSGTVGTGCLLELGLPWLKSGDIVEFEIEKLGVLKNTVK